MMNCGTSPAETAAAVELETIGSTGTARALGAPPRSIRPAVETAARVLVVDFICALLPGRTMVV
jgi:hypothetical protein